MSKKNVTYDQLFNYYNEIQLWRKNQSILVEFNASKIKAFEDKHRIRISTILQGLKEIDTEFCQHKEHDDGTIEFLTVDNKNEELLYKEGKTKQEHELLTKVFMQKETVMEI